MNENQKLKAYISYLINTGKVENQQEFGQTLGYKNKTSFSRLLSAPLSEKFIKKLQTSYPDYERWSMRLNNDIEVYQDVKPKTYPTHLEVRLVTTKARAGYTDSYYADEFLKDMPVILVESDKEYKGKYLAFEVDGDSMEPEYFAGDIVICREVKRDLWQYKLHYNDYDFVIAHATKGIMLKEIVDHNTDTGEITCHSLNQSGGKNKDFKLNLREVLFLYNIVEHRRSGKSKRQHR